MVENECSRGDQRTASRGIKALSSVANIQGENIRAPIRVEGNHEDLPNAFDLCYSRFENHDHDLSDHLNLQKQGISADQSSVRGVLMTL